MQQVKPPVGPASTAEKRRSVKRTADTSPVFAAALERLNRRSVIALIEEVIEQLNEHCEKIGITIEHNAEIKSAHSKLEIHLHDLRVANDNCMIEINSIRQEINSLHAHIPCISVIEKIEELNKKIDAMSEEKISSQEDGPHPKPPKNKESKLAWCSSCFCIAAFILAAAALAIVLHTEYHKYTAACQQQGQDRLAMIESRLKQLEEQQTRQSSSQVAVVSVLETKVTVLEKELNRIIVLLNAKQDSSAADQMRKIQEQVATLTDKLTRLEERQPVPLPSNNTPQEPSNITAVSALESKVLTLETNLQLLDSLFQQKIDIHTQAIAKLEQCCAAKPAPPSPPEPKPAPAPTPEPEPKPIVLSGVNFTTGSSTLTEGDKKILTEVAATLKGGSLSQQKFEVAGHTDNKGDAKKNQRLSQDRADAVRKFLIVQGIRSDLLTSKGYGLTKPIADNTTEEGRAKNRRVELDKQ